MLNGITRGSHVHDSYSHSRQNQMSSSSREQDPLHSLPSLRHSLPSGRPLSMSASGRQALLALDIIVVGGGIGGLSLAYTLSIAGHRVHVLERANCLNQTAGACRLPPNATKILVQWGLEEELKKAAALCRSCNFRSMETNEEAGYLQWHQDVMQEIGADYYVACHADIQRMLYNLAVDAGAYVSFGATVIDVQPPEHNDDLSGPCVLLSDGRQLRADMVVGSDGNNSRVRKIVTEAEDDFTQTGMSSYTTTIPIEEVRQDPLLADVGSTPGEWTLWMGPRRSAFAYLTRGGSELGVNAFWPDADLGHTTRTESWDDLCETRRFAFGNYNPVLERLMNLAPSLLRVTWVDRRPVSDWVDFSGRIALIGDAAHPSMPCSMHNISLTLEDAVVFGRLLSHLRSWAQLPHLLEAYQDLRQARCEMVYRSELANAALVTLPPGPERDARDAGMRQSRTRGKEHWDEGELLEQWETISDVLGYSASEAVDDWYYKWGALEERSKAAVVGEPFTVRFETKTEVSTSA